MAPWEQWILLLGMANLSWESQGLGGGVGSPGSWLLAYGVSWLLGHNWNFMSTALIKWKTFIKWKSFLKLETSLSNLKLLHNIKNYKIKNFCCKKHLIQKTKRWTTDWRNYFQNTIGEKSVLKLCQTVPFTFGKDWKTHLVKEYKHICT